MKWITHNIRNKLLVICGTRAAPLLAAALTAHVGALAKHKIV